MKVFFAPEYPDKEFYTIVPIFMRLGYFACTDPKDHFDFAMAWQDRTWLSECPALEDIAQHKPVLNLRCRDISKHRVEQIFSRVFGYSTFVDPTTHQGPCVMKHDENAIGGSIIECPVTETDSRYVYQRIIDSRLDRERMIEYRVPVILGSIPQMYTLEKDVPGGTIKTRKRSVRITELSDVFSTEEFEHILGFCRAMHLDFGELDILRSNDDGRIYILDANKTAAGFGMRNMVNWLPDERRRAVDGLSEAFDAAIKRLLNR